jgi:hypothetical protein
MGNISNTKVCNYCKQALLLDQFSPDKRNSDGRQSRCRRCVKKTRQERHNMNRSNGLCWCGSNKTINSSLCEKHQDMAREHHRRLMKDPVWKKELAIRNKKKHIQLKKECFVAYGGLICACCGEKEFQFLTMDHIIPVGNISKSGPPLKENRGLGSKKKPSNRSGNGLWRWLKKNKYPPGYQVLCWNCNCAKGLFGSCPHTNKKHEDDDRIIISDEEIERDY